MSITERIRQVLRRFETIGLDELDDVRLMNRRDMKYVFPVHLVPDLLTALAPHYRVLEIEGRRGQAYETIYYDTKDLDMYKMHHRGKRERHKVRFRKYASSGTVFLEVKRKDNRGVTEKNRVECEGAERWLLSEEEEFLSTHSPYDQERLSPVIENSFNRITLISRHEKERITIDHDLVIRDAGGPDEVDLQGIAIAEVKREGTVRHSLLSDYLKKEHVQPMRFSKYCVGVAKLHSTVPSNRFREVLRKVDHMNEPY